MADSSESLMFCLADEGCPLGRALTQILVALGCGVRRVGYLVEPQRADLRHCAWPLYQWDQAGYTRFVLVISPPIHNIEGMLPIVRWNTLCHLRGNGNRSHLVVLCPAISHQAKEGLEAHLSGFVWDGRLLDLLRRVRDEDSRMTTEVDAAELSVQYKAGLANLMHSMKNGDLFRPYTSEHDKTFCRRLLSVLKMDFTQLKLADPANLCERTLWWIENAPERADPGESLMKEWRTFAENCADACDNVQRSCKFLH